MSALPPTFPSQEPVSASPSPLRPPALPDHYRDAVARWLDQVAAAWIGAPPADAVEALVALAQDLRATAGLYRQRSGQPGQPGPLPATTDDRATMVAGDLGRSLAPRHHGRHYLIIEVIEADHAVGITERVLWGRRYYPSSGRAEGPVHPIEHPLQKTGTREGHVPTGKQQRRERARVEEFAVGDLVEDASLGGTALWRNKYRITRLGGPGMFGRVIFGQRATRDKGIAHGPEMQITWPVRKAAPGKGDR